MYSKSFTFYDFAGLRFDSERSFLIRLSDEEKVHLRSKESLLLLELVKKPNQTVTYEELQQSIWNETTGAQMILRRLQVTKDTLQKKINNLRQANDNPEIIKSVSLKGYVFVLPVEQPEFETEKEIETKSLGFSSTTDSIDFDNSAIEVKERFDQSTETRIVLKTKKSMFVIAAVLLIGVMMVFGFLIFYFKPDEENEVRRVVKESQMYESMMLYQNPANFDKNKLKEYWINESHNGDLDIAKIRKSLDNLIQKDERYGKESKCEKFDFVSVEINENKDFAVVKTIEKWFVAKYGSDGNLLENKNIGPYSVTYNLRKINGKWLIEKSSTARAGS